MDFKIDTKDTFTIITPLNEVIDAKMTGALGAKCEEMRQSGSNNFIIDLENCKTIDKTCVSELIALQGVSYDMDLSFVYTKANDEITKAIRDEDEDFIINLAPRMDEAIDIISMEILERDLFNEE
jgi:anti-anti-sigma regulatory factor